MRSGRRRNGRRTLAPRPAGCQKSAWPPELRQCASVYAAGELKHGPIALIGPGLPVVIVVPPPGDMKVLHDKIVSNIQEIRARRARTIVIAEHGNTKVAPYATR